MLAGQLSAKPYDCLSSPNRSHYVREYLTRRGWLRGSEAYEKREAARNDLIVFISKGRARKY